MSLPGAVVNCTKMKPIVLPAKSVMLKAWMKWMVEGARGPVGVRVALKPSEATVRVAKTRTPVFVWTRMVESVTVRGLMRSEN